MCVWKIEGCEKLSVTTTAADVEIGYRNFMIENLSDSALVYFREKDGAAATANNAFAVPAGKMIDHVFTAKTLSVVGSANADVRILYVDSD